MPDHTLYFVAILPAPDQQEMITGIKQYFAEKFHARHALKSPPHITLIPPFKWPVNKERQLTEILHQFAISQSAFSVVVSGFGAFKPSVIYAAIETNKDLDLLQNKLSEYMKDKTGLALQESEKRPYHPHMTLAFKDLKRNIFHKAWEEFKDKTIEFDFWAESIALLKHNGKYWEILEVLYFGN